MSFDITSWYRYRPTSEICLHCYAMYQPGYLPGSTAATALGWVGLPGGRRKCRVCNFVHEDDSFISRRGIDAEPNLKELARIGSCLPPHTKPGAMYIEPLALLFQAIGTAKWNVNFVTYSIDSTVLGALQMASHNVKVRGIIGTLNDFSRSALETIGGFDLRNPHARLAMMTSTTKTPMVDGVHNKMLFIDGVLAFKGSANLTLNGYSKAGRATLTESLEAVTVPDQVAELNNTFFARLWAQNTTPLAFEDLIPF